MSCPGPFHNTLDHRFTPPGNWVSKYWRASFLPFLSLCSPPVAPTAPPEQCSLPNFPPCSVLSPSLKSPPTRGRGVDWAWGEGGGRESGTARDKNGKATIAASPHSPNDLVSPFPLTRSRAGQPVSRQRPSRKLPRRRGHTGVCSVGLRSRSVVSLFGPHLTPPHTHAPTRSTSVIPRNHCNFMTPFVVQTKMREKKANKQTTKRMGSRTFCWRTTFARLLRPQSTAKVNSAQYIHLCLVGVNKIRDPVRMSATNARGVHAPAAVIPHPR